MSQAIGTGNVAFGDSSSATGSSGATALGANASATKLQSTAIGQGALADGDFSTAVGSGATANGNFSSAFGAGSQASAANALALGAGAEAAGQFSTSVGTLSLAAGPSSVASGYNSVANVADSVALGANSTASAVNSVALGAGSVANRANAVSIGTGLAGGQRQLINLAAGTANTDAVNLGQLNTLTAALGGGASFSGGVFTAPTYTIQGSNFNTVGAAFAAVDSRLTGLSTQIAAIPAGPPGGGANSVTYEDASQSRVTLAGANGTRVSNVANATAATDAVNLRQSQAATLQSANAYTDQRFNAITLDFSGMRAEMNDRFQDTDRRISRNSAMSAAMMQMAANSAYAKPGRGRLAIGAGFHEGQSAISIGYGRRIGDNVSLSIGGAFASGESSGGVGVGFDL